MSFGVPRHKTIMAQKYGIECKCFQEKSFQKFHIIHQIIWERNQEKMKNAKNFHSKSANNNCFIRCLLKWNWWWTAAAFITRFNELTNNHNTVSMYLHYQTDTLSPVPHRHGIGWSAVICWKKNYLESTTRKKEQSKRCHFDKWHLLEF